MGLGKFAGIGVAIWVGYILIKNRNMTNSIAEMKGDISSLKNKVTSMVSPAPTTGTVATVPSVEANKDENNSNFDWLPVLHGSYQKLRTPYNAAALRHYDTSLNATTSPDKFVIYEGLSKDDIALMH